MPEHKFILGLIGYPLKHSFSKKYFGEKFALEKITHVEYQNFEIASIDMVKDILTIPHLKGLNVTIPYKQAIIPFTHQQSPEVKAIGAANCLKIEADGSITAYNTDIIGIKKTLISLQPEEDWKGIKALILGTGGASLAVQYVLGEVNMDYLLVSRSPNKENARVIGYEEVNEQIMNDYKLIINTTPLGTFPDIERCPPLPYQFLSLQHILFDLVYNPAETAFLNHGKKKSCLIENGLYMLHEQAEAGWDIWGLKELSKG